MKTTLAFMLVIVFAAAALAGAPPKNACATIQGGTITDTKGNPVQVGYDQWGYNYQAMMFNGFYDNFSRPAVLATSGDSLIMKWNDAWLSNKDCGVDGVPNSSPDGKLDRHYGFPSYIGSGAWLTNHQTGSYEVDGKTYHWTYFVKIVAVPADAVLVNGIWKTAGGIEIGPAIWGEFATIQEIYNDEGAGLHGVQYKTAVAPGFGVYKP